MASKANARSQSATQSGVPYAISYMRFSTLEQKKGDTVRRQRQQALDWSVRTRIPINETITDAGKSAYNNIAAGFQTILKMVEAGQIPSGTYLLVESLDRITRSNVLDAMPLTMSLIKKGIIIVSLIDGQQYSYESLQDNGKLFLWMSSLCRSHEESALKSIRVKEAWEDKRAKARDDQTVMTELVPGWLEVVGRKKDRKIVVNDKRVEIVQRIFDMTIEGYGRRQIVRTFNDAKPPIPPFGRAVEWHTSAINKILTNRAVLGEVQPHTKPRHHAREPSGDPVPTYFPAIIPREVFYRAAQAVGSRRKAGGRVPSTYVNMLTGLGVCRECGSRMQIINKGKRPKGARYFVCSNFDRRAGCSNQVRWRVDAIEASVLDSGRWVNWSSAIPPAVTGETAEGWRHELAEYRRKRDLANRLALNGDDTLEERSKEYTRAILALQKKLREFAETEAKQAALPTGEENRRMLATLQSRLEAAGDDEIADIRTKMAQAIRRSIAKLVFSGSRVEAFFKPVRRLDGGASSPPPIIIARKGAIDIGDDTDLAFQRSLEGRPERPDDDEYDAA
ncbi:Site-specific DNA recombinase [Bosea robiniae]|uniref:Site-specific DNA recombinase n=2 Tax=Bosea robiniae TaxID=1036780 RepID=A0ABY0NYY7_9HYPH|nr:Site-specific DNA recombinase [Bosea robiniae]